MESERAGFPTWYLVLGTAGILTLALFQVLDMIILGLLIAVVLIPAHRWISRFIHPTLSAILISFLLFVILAVVVIGTVDILTANSAILRDQVNAIQHWVVDPRSDFSRYGIPFEGRQISAWIDQSEIILEEYWLNISRGSVGIFIKVGVFFISLSFFIGKGEWIWNRIRFRIPENFSDPVHRLSSISVDCLYAIFVVHIIMAVVTFAIAIPFFWFLGWGNVLFYSFVTFICELIPVLGASIIMVYLGGYSLAIGDIPAFFILALIGYPVVALAPEIFIRPVLTGRRVHIHPVVMIIGFFGGILTMGLIGFVLGPLLLTLLISGYRIMVEEKPMREWINDVRLAWTGKRNPPQQNG